MLADCITKTTVAMPTLCTARVYRVGLVGKVLLAGRGRQGPGFRRNTRVPDSGLPSVFANMSYEGCGAGCVSKTLPLSSPGACSQMAGVPCSEKTFNARKASVQAAPPQKACFLCPCFAGAGILCSISRLLISQCCLVGSQGGGGEESCTPSGEKQLKKQAHDVGRAWGPSSTQIWVNSSSFIDYNAQPQPSSSSHCFSIQAETAKSQCYSVHTQALFASPSAHSTRKGGATWDQIYSNPTLDKQAKALACLLSHSGLGPSLPRARELAHARASGRIPSQIISPSS